ncbi:hypothetical protein [Arcobacter cloacae]|uniref:hypothetical protein n=1 Tax=Arcobacter cloacae TaxID=1054034 RepID=UPI0013E91E69|nr:hypothetical protein [Arcobacter cloacae]QKF89538.1 hypothetical protein ACLO_1032 [Arcobacter cloacae]
MKKKYKIYLLLSIIFTLILFALGIGVRYIIDPAGLNNKFNLGLYKDIALAYRTQKFVELNQIKPDTLMVGGSRVHYLNPEDLKKYTNDKVYNLGLSYSTLEEQYYFLKYSLENLQIKNVILGINLYTFSEVLEDNSSDFDKDIFTNKFNFYQQIKHYLEVPLYKYLKYAYNNTNTEPVYKDGAITAYHQQIVLTNNPEEKRWSNSVNGYRKKYRDYLEWGESGLDYLKKMVELCEEHNVNLKVFTTAIHTSQLELLEELNKMDIYYKWKEEVAKITPYWDFMYSNSITTNKDNFIDSSHIKQEFGYLYFARLFDDSSVNVPKDFGIYVEKK